MVVITEFCILCSCYFLCRFVLHGMVAEVGERERES